MSRGVFELHMLLDQINDARRCKKIFSMKGSYGDINKGYKGDF